MNKLYNDFINFLIKAELFAYADYQAELLEARETEGGCTDAYEMALDDAYGRYREYCQNLRQYAEDRGCNPDDLDQIFG